MTETADRPVAVVTGASRGLGFLLARTLIRGRCGAGSVVTPPALATEVPGSLAEPDRAAARCSRPAWFELPYTPR